MMVDNTSVSPVVTKYLIESINKLGLLPIESKSIKFIESQGTNNLNDVAPIYNKWIYFYLKNFEDRTAEGFKAFLETHVMKQVVAKQISKGASLWWDNVKRN
jgi:penicillin amidase